MTQITVQDGKIVVRDGKVGTGQGCCCGGGGCCSSVTWHRVHGACNNLPDDFLVSEVDEDCYAYYVFEDWDCQNPLVGRDCGDGGEYGQCNIYARVKITGNTPSVIEYLQSMPDEEEVWSPGPPGARCGCPDSFGSLSVECNACYGVSFGFLLGETGGAETWPCGCAGLQDYVDQINGKYDELQTILQGAGYCVIDLTPAEGVCYQCPQSFCGPCEGPEPEEAALISLGGINAFCCCEGGQFCAELINAEDENGDPLPGAIELPSGVNTGVSSYVMPCPGCSCPECNPLP